ncbi:hypothetical protein OF83DRAFT_1089179 [Amylostereum chailletii]|nr:hypothetical protein OF83DRAFT_1089179 [Amylostereum chailletii]
MVLAAKAPVEGGFKTGQYFVGQAALSTQFTVNRRKGSGRKGGMASSPEDTAGFTKAELAEMEEDPDADEEEPPLEERAARAPPPTTPSPAEKQLGLIQQARADVVESDGDEDEGGLRDAGPEGVNEGIVDEVPGPVVRPGKWKAAPVRTGPPKKRKKVAAPKTNPTGPPRGKKAPARQVATASPTKIGTRSTTEGVTTRSKAGQRRRWDKL